ncbi:hypothetical protein BC830DRAFT_1104486 [Chytriomyces sp. MP71]|nr:hypothetical protein BC830DRAFT_1104486 [Chytriomyces sp. MP71]
MAPKHREKDKDHNDPNRRRFKDVLGVSDRYSRQLPNDPLTVPSLVKSLIMAAHAPPLGAATSLDTEAAQEEARRIQAIMKTSRTVRQSALSFVVPDPMPDPVIVALSKSTATLLALDIEDKDLLAAITAQRLPQESIPYAHNYGGHQFGYYVGQLGDGRCVSLGEVSVPIQQITKSNMDTPRQPSENRSESKTHNVFEIQLKGSGRTPYSRANSDGLAQLRSSLREYLASEYMNALGIPTTLALAIVSGSRGVYRDKGLEPGAMVTRVASSWIRFGTFELFWYRGEKDLLKQLADFALSVHFDHLDQNKEYLDIMRKNVRVPVISVVANELGKAYTETSSEMPMLTLTPRKPGTPQDIDLARSAMESAGPGGMIGPYTDGTTVTIELNRYARLFKEIVKKTAELCAHWQAAGFIHGLLNTDNMSIHGVTMDYGPFMFMDSYDPGLCSCATDTVGRYRFENQPYIVFWNLSKLGRTFHELVMLDANDEQYRGIDGKNVINGILATYDDVFIDAYVEIMGQKLGIQRTESSDLEVLILPLLQLLSDTDSDYATFFRAVGQIRLTNDEFKAELGPLEKDPFASSSDECLVEEDENEPVLGTISEVANEKKKDQYSKSTTGGSYLQYMSIEEYQQLQLDLADVNGTQMDGPTKVQAPPKKKREPLASRQSQPNTTGNNAIDKLPSGCLESLISSTRTAIKECTQEIEVMQVVKSAATSRNSVTSATAGVKRGGKLRSSIAAVAGAVMVALSGTPPGKRMSTVAGLKGAASKVAGAGDTKQIGRTSVSGVSRRISIDHNAKKPDGNTGGMVKAMRSTSEGEEDAKDNDNDFSEIKMDILVEEHLHSLNSNRRRSIRLASDIVNEMEQLNRQAKFEATELNQTLDSKVSKAQSVDTEFNNQAKVQGLFPTEPEIRYRWQEWLIKYRSRLITEIITLNPSNGISAAMIEAEDNKRRARMRRKNPKYSLRGWILEEICDKIASMPEVQPIDAEIARLQEELRILGEVEKRTLANTSKSDDPSKNGEDDLNNELQDLLTKLKRGEPIQDPTTTKKEKESGHRKPKLVSPLSAEGMEPVNQAVRILIADIWGDVSESAKGWENMFDKEAASKWGGKVPKWKDNIVQPGAS